MPQSRRIRVGPGEHAMIMELAVRLGVPAGGAVARWPRCPRCGFILAASPRGRDRVACHRCGAEYVMWYRP